jgi:recombination protein RecR
MASQEIEALAGALARLPARPGARRGARCCGWSKRRETALVQLLEALASVRETLSSAPPAATSTP